MGFVDNEANIKPDRFGWVNASYVYGLSILKDHAKRAIGTLTPYTTFEKATALDEDFTEEPLEVTDEEDGLTMA